MSYGLVMKRCFIDNSLWTKSHWLCTCILFVICITTIFFLLNHFLGKHVHVRHLETTMAISTQAQRIKLCEFCQDTVQNFCRGCKYGLCSYCTANHFLLNPSKAHDIVPFRYGTGNRLFFRRCACLSSEKPITVLIAVIHFVIIVKVAIPSIHRVAYQNISTCLLIYYKIRI